jgi:hypothetical protein
MMLFIPLCKGTHTSPDYQEKILFKHDRYHGDKAVVCIGGLKDLNTKAKKQQHGHYLHPS